MAKLRPGLFLLSGVRALFDREAPASARVAAAAAVLYTVFPFDVAPDVVPFVGWVDDLAVASVLLALAARLASAVRCRAVVPASRRSLR